MVKEKFSACINSRKNARQFVSLICDYLIFVLDPGYSFFGFSIHRNPSGNKLSLFYVLPLRYTINPYSFIWMKKRGFCNGIQIRKICWSFNNSFDHTSHPDSRPTGCGLFQQNPTSNTNGQQIPVEAARQKERENNPT